LDAVIDDRNNKTVPVSLWPIVFEWINRKIIRGEKNPFDSGCKNWLEPTMIAANAIYFLIRNNVGPVLRE
jgi:hypothetical protein